MTSPEIHSVAEPVDHTLRLEVSEVIRETADAATIVFAGNPQALTWLPGQFLTLRVPQHEGFVARCYSLCSSPDLGEAPAVTVKRVADGRASTWLVDKLTAGQVIETLKPSGRFTPVDFGSDLLLLGAGSGITPLMSILKSALHVGEGKIALLYANRSENDVIFLNALRDLSANHPNRLIIHHWLDSVQGYPDPARVAHLLAPYRDREAYVCGPAPFMDTVKASLNLLDVPRDRLHIEQFVSLTSDPFAEVIRADTEPDETTSLVDVRLNGELQQLTWPASMSLLDLLLDAGLDVPYSCRAGECGSCAATLVGGTVDMANREALDDKDVAEGYILACQSHPASAAIEVSF